MRALERLIGREKELAELAAAIDDVARGRSRVVLIAGEPGVGKSRLVAESSALAARRDFRVMRGACVSAASGEAYWVWRQALESEPQAHLGIAADHLAVDGGDQQRLRSYEAWTGLIRRYAADAPLLLALEDLHWADRSSLGLLEFVCEQLASERVLLLGTYRDSEVSASHPLARALGIATRAPGFGRLRLSGLSTAEAGLLMSSLLDSDVPRAFLIEAYRLSEGNPLFLREIALDSVQSEKSGRSGHHQMWIPASVGAIVLRRAERLSGPCRAFLELAAQFRTEFSRQMVEEASAAVQGPVPADVSLVLDEALDADILKHAEAAGAYRFSHGLIQQVLSEQVPLATARRYHARIAATMIEMLGSSGSARLADIAGRLAQGLHPAFAAVGPMGFLDSSAASGRAGTLRDHVREVAWHLEQAGALAPPSDIVRYAYLAGQIARVPGSEETAVRYLTLALRTAKETPPGNLAVDDTEVVVADITAALAQTSQLIAVSLPQRQAAWDLLTEAFDAYRQLGRHQAAVSCAASFASFRGLKGPFELTSRALEIAEPGSLMRGFLLLRHAVALLDEKGESAGARRALLEARSIARSASDLKLETWTHVHLGQVAYAECDFPESVNQGRQFIELGQMLPENASCRSYAFAVPSLLALGDLSAASTMAAEHRGCADRFPWWTHLYMAGISVWLVSYARGDWDRARHATADLRDVRIGSPGAATGAALESLLAAVLGDESPPAEQAVIQARALGVEAQGARALSLGCWAAIAHDTGNEAVMALVVTRARAALASLPRLRLADVDSQAALGFAAVMRRDPAEASRLLRLLAPESGRMDTHAGFSFDRLLGLLAKVAGEADSATRYVAAALERCDKLGFRVEAAFAHYALADAIAATRDAAALRVLEDALSRAQALAMKPLAARLNLLKQALAGPENTSRKSVAAGLTSREVEVLRLVAAGKSNAEIAADLVITTNTAAKHVANIFAKIGAENRTEAAAYAIRQGLT